MYFAIHVKIYKRWMYGKYYINFPYLNIDDSHRWASQDCATLEIQGSISLIAITEDLLLYSSAHHISFCSFKFLIMHLLETRTVI